jgi:type IV pilus assembly protein PilP
MKYFFTRTPGAGQCSSAQRTAEVREFLHGKGLLRGAAAEERAGQGHPLFGPMVCFLLLTVFCSVQAMASPEPEKPVSRDVAEITAPSWIGPSEYVYDPTGKPDPFMPFIRRVAEERLDPVRSETDRPRTPLEMVEVRELRLEGIIQSIDAPDSAMAMVELPDGKGFILRKGMVVGKRQGIVEEIGQDRISVRERYVTLFGEEKSRDVVLKLYSGDGKEQ